MDTIINLIKMILPRKKSTEDMEQGRFDQGKPHPISTTLDPPLPHVQYDQNGRPEIAADDQLNLFRHLTGITSHPSMAQPHFSSGGRPAPNLGIYARVIHNEETSKNGYKRFSWLINGCLGLQIIVAAALTALGAAGASHSAITVFGAINTVIAGILTFLKGSGLPNRFKYYQTEWKRIREFIEQRERDFSRPGCDLDIYGVVSMIENMYEGLKMDIEASTPDRFAGVNSARKSMQQIEPTKAMLPRTTGEGLGDKFKEFEAGFGGRIKELASEIGYKSNQTRDATKDFQAHAQHVDQDAEKELKEYAERAERLESSFSNRVKDLASDIGHKAHLAQSAAQDLQAHRRSEIEQAGKEGRDYVERAEREATSRLRGPITINLPGAADA